MFKRRRRGFSGRRSFRRKRAVAWQTQSELHGQETLTVATIDDLPEYFGINQPTNLFLQEAPRFAKSLDVMTLKRLVGTVRIGTYLGEGDFSDLDTEVYLGICIVKGDYAQDGTWTQKDEPDPSEPGDNLDKWLFKDYFIMAFGNERSFTDAGSTITVQTRPRLLANTDRLPNGDHIDLKLGRRLEFGEKVMIVTKLVGTVQAVQSFYLNYDLRMLCAKWG